MPSDQCPLQQPPSGPTNLPSIKTGQTIVVLSVLFFLITGYASFFSAFIPSPSNFVRGLGNTIHRCRLSNGEKGLKSRGGRWPLQVPHAVSDTYLFLFRHRELGGVAILPELLKLNVSSADRVNTLLMVYDNQNKATAQYNTANRWRDRDHGDGDLSVGGRDRLWTCLSSCHSRPLPPPSFRFGAGSVALVGLWVLPPHEVDERAGLTARVDARLENLGREVAASSLKAPVFWLGMSETEAYDEGNSLLVDVG